VNRGVVGSIQEAFDVWLGQGKPGYVERDEMDAATALRLARASGGVPVVAHPLSLGLAGASFENALAELVGLGLGGLECLYGRYHPEEREALSRMAQRHGLAVTGGSDFHGSYKPDLSIGKGRGDLHVPDSVLDDLRNRIIQTTA
jgi:predicted metal-dependent phosphoesterase TrpH